MRIEVDHEFVHVAFGRRNDFVEAGLLGAFQQGRAFLDRNGLAARGLERERLIGRQRERSGNRIAHDEGCILARARHREPADLLDERQEGGSEREVTPRAIGRGIDDDHAPRAALPVNDERKIVAEREQYVALLVEVPLEHLALGQRGEGGVCIPGIGEKRMLRLDRPRGETPHRQLLDFARLGRQPFEPADRRKIRLVTGEENHGAAAFEIPVEPHGGTIADVRHASEEYGGIRIDRKLVEFVGRDGFNRRASRTGGKRLAQKESGPGLVGAFALLDDDDARRLVNGKQKIRVIVGREIVAG